MQSAQRIILIDNDKIVTMICAHIINTNMPDIEVVMFTCPEQGLAFIRQECQSTSVNTVLLLDINMPTLSGWEVLEHLKTDSEKVLQNFTIYMFSSSVSYEDKDMSTKHPMVSGFVEKPLSAQKLCEITNPMKSIA